MGIRTILPVLAALAAVATTGSATASSYRVVYSFKGGNDGGNPLSSLIKVGDALYGTTSVGGIFDCNGGCGTVFSINPRTGGETILHSFESNGTGANPQDGLTNLDGTLYGTTAGGGIENLGIVFSVNLGTSAEAVVYSFTGGDDGFGSSGGLIKVEDTLFGTTSHGGSSGVGTVFKLNPVTGAESEVYSFQGGSDGLAPLARLLKVGDKLFGTTVGGGTGSCPGGCGTVFSINRRTGAESVVYSFKSGSDGAYPRASLTDVAGELFGTTGGGGTGSCPGGCGTIFSVDRKTGTEKMVYSFKGGNDGLQPWARLIYAGGMLYGTTVYGGAGSCSSGCGTVFSVNPKTGAETVAYSFQGGSDGATPYASLTNVQGTLYGTTEQGGTAECYYGTCGTVFAYTP